MLIIWGWEQMLTGFEIIVASSNNVPAENISREIPTCGAIDGEDASYYPELATTVLNSDSIQHRKSPGAGSACLGRKSNRIKFANAFWFSDKRAGVKGFQDILKGYERAPFNGWPTAVQAFRAALRGEQDLRAERAMVRQIMTELPAVRENITDWGRSACRLGSYSGYSEGAVVKVRPCGVRQIRTPGSG